LRPPAPPHPPAPPPARAAAAPPAAPAPPPRRYEAGRTSVARLVNAPERGVVFTKNVSEAVNLVAWAWGVRTLRPGDEVLVSIMEHHSNIVPWQIVAEITGATVRFCPIAGEGELDLEAV